MATTNTFKIESIFTGVDRLSRPVNKMGASISRFNRRATTGMSAMSGTFDGMVSTFRTGSIAIGVAVGAAALVLVDAAKVGATFEQSITNAMAKFPGGIKRGTEAFRELEDAAKHVGKTTEFTASQTAEAINFLASAGFTAKQAIGALPGVVDLATASQTGLAEATLIATKTLGAFGLRAKDPIQLTKNLTRVNDVFAKTVNSSSATMESLFEVVRNGGPAFKAAGFDLETFAAIAGAMANASIDGSKAGTAMKQMAIKLAKPSELAARQMKELGVQVKNAEGGFTGMLEILRQVDAGFDRLDVGKVDRLANLSEIFGDRAVGPVATLLENGILDLKAYRDEFFEVEGMSKRVAETMRNTVAGSFKTLASAIESVKIELFGDKRNLLKQDLDDLTTWVRDNGPELREELGAIADVFRDLAKFGVKAFEFVRLFRTEGGDVALGFQRSQKERDQAAADAGTFRPIVEDVDLGGLGPSTNRLQGLPTREEFNKLFEDFDPVSTDGQSAIVGNGTRKGEGSTTTTKVIVEAEAGTKARIEGEDNPAVQMAPSGGL